MTYSPENINSTHKAIEKYIHAVKNKKKHDKLISRRFSKFIAQENKEFGEDVWSVIKSFMVTDFYLDADWLPAPNTKILAPNDFQLGYYTIEIGKRVSWNFVWARRKWEDNVEVIEPFKLHKIYRSMIKHPDNDKLIMSEDIEGRWFYDYEEDVVERIPHYRNCWAHHQFNAEQNRHTLEEVARLKKALVDNEPFIELSDFCWLAFMGVQY